MTTNPSQTLRCGRCGQPLVFSDQYHTLEDCERWRDADRHSRDLTESLVAERGRRA